MRPLGCTFDIVVSKWVFYGFIMPFFESRRKVAYNSLVKRLRNRTSTIYQRYFDDISTKINRCYVVVVLFSYRSKSASYACFMRFSCVSHIRAKIHNPQDIEKEYRRKWQFFLHEGPYIRIIVYFCSTEKGSDPAVGRLLGC